MNTILMKSTAVVKALRFVAKDDVGNHVIEVAVAHPEGEINTSLWLNTKISPDGEIGCSEAAKSFLLPALENLGVDPLDEESFAQAEGKTLDVALTTYTNEAGVTSSRWELAPMASGAAPKAAGFLAKARARRAA